MNANSPAPFPLSHSEIFLARGHLRLLTTSDNCRGSSRKLTAAALRRYPGVTYKTGRLMCQRLHRGMKGPFVRNLFIAMRGHRTRSRFFTASFPICANLR